MKRSPGTTTSAVAAARFDSGPEHSLTHSLRAFRWLAVGMAQRQGRTGGLTGRGVGGGVERPGKGGGLRPTSGRQEVSDRPAIFFNGSERRKRR